MKALSPRTKAYLLTIYAAGASILIWQLMGIHVKETWMLVALCVAGSLAAIFTVEGATDRSHYTVSFLVYGFTFAHLGTAAALIVIAVSCLAEWVFRRAPWFILLFNATCYMILMYVAHLAFVALNPAEDMNGATAVLALSIAMAAFTVLNHLLVGIVVWLARGENFEKSGVFDLLPLMIDMTLLCLGGSMAIVWNYNPYALALLALPLYLIYSTLRVPSLERQTETDSKTGLFNHGYFMQQIDSELNRANRFDRPMTIVMADLDLLRNINNTYGHLAGDEVLIRIASLFRQAVREYDVVARFGGEEFSILMPETTLEEAFGRAENIRQAIEQAAFIISTSVTPIHVTVSIGIACRERFDEPAEEIIHNADTALYHAKLKGRNQTYICSDQTYETFLQEGDSSAHRTTPTSVPEPPAAADQHEETNYSAARAVRTRPTEPKPGVEERQPKPPEAPAKANAVRQTAFSKVNLYITVVTAIALLSWAEVARLSSIDLLAYSAVDWLSLAVFAVLVVLTEWFSVELYVKHTTVSTSAVPILAGTLLFGPLGALVLSATFAITALVKYRSPISRLFFNLGNQLLAATIYTGLLALTAKHLVDYWVLIQLGICLIASFIVYLVTTALVATGVAIDLRQRVLLVWKEQYAWLVSSYVGMGFISYALIFGYQNNHVIGVLLMVVPLALLRMSQEQYVARTRTMVGELHEKQRALESTSGEMQAVNDGLLDTLAEVIDLGDPYVLGHSIRVADLATRIARQLGLHDKQVNLIRNASMLHDIGKLGISANILSKPAKLTVGEYEEVKRHVTLGVRLLEKSRGLRALAPVVGGHHEHYDGRGYPNGRKGNEIPLEARIIAASDAIETMASDRPYSKAMSSDKIVEELQRCSGSQFDPLVVEAAIRVLAEGHQDGAVEHPRAIPNMTQVIRDTP